MRQGGTVSPASTHAVFPHLQRYSPVFGAFWPDLTVMRLSTSLLCVVIRTDGGRAFGESQRVGAELSVDGARTRIGGLDATVADRSDEV